MPLEMKYFVLKPSGEGPHAFASRRAMLTYAKEIERVDPELAKELRAWIEKESYD